jgi:cytochrome bd-type quinol oxidase subunit 2
VFTGLHAVTDRRSHERVRLRTADLLWAVLLLLGPVVAGIIYWVGISTSRVKVPTDFLKYRDCGSPLLDSAPAGDAECAQHMSSLRVVVLSALAVFLMLLTFAIVRVVREYREKRAARALHLAESG